MDAYIFHGMYHGGFDISHEMGKNYVKEGGADGDHWTTVLYGGDDHPGVVEIKEKDALYMYGGRAALVEALEFADKVRPFEIRCHSDGPSDKLLLAHGVVTIPLTIAGIEIDFLDRGTKRLLMICQHTDERVDQIGADNLIKDSSENTATDTLDAPGLIRIISELPDV
jgi:hypothetical protein